MIGIDKLIAAYPPSLIIATLLPNDSSLVDLFIVFTGYQHLVFAASKATLTPLFIAVSIHA